MSCSSCKLCSYALSQSSRPMYQPFYSCSTCNNANEAGESATMFCLGCSESCHKDHDVEFVAECCGVCSCGSANCALLQQTVKEHSHYALPRPEDSEPGDNVPCVNSTDNLYQYVKPFEAHSLRRHGIEQPAGEHVDEVLPSTNEYCTLLREECCALVGESKETFWIGSTETPRCHLEAFALQAYQYHTRRIVAAAERNAHDCGREVETAGGSEAGEGGQGGGMGRIMAGERSGAEFWVQVKRNSPKSGDRSQVGSSQSNVAATTIALHYDKDEEVAELFALGVYPLVSTVTYLTGAGAAETSAGLAAPTVVFSHRYEDAVEQSVEDCYVSYPVVGKHISFDGRLLHGAPSDEGLQKIVSSTASFPPPPPAAAHCDNGDSGAIRVTLLVNVWVDYRPAGVQSMPLEYIRSDGRVAARASAVGDTCSCCAEGAAPLIPPLLLQLPCFTEAENAMTCVTVDAGGSSSISLEEGEAVLRDAFGEELDPSVEHISLPFLAPAAAEGDVGDTDAAGVGGAAGADEDEEELLYVHMWVPSCIRQPQKASPTRPAAECYHVHYDNEDYIASLENFA